VAIITENSVAIAMNREKGTMVTYLGPSYTRTKAAATDIAKLIEQRRIARKVIRSFAQADKVVLANGADMQCGGKFEHPYSVHRTTPCKTR
jgi:hypothetical protein